MCIGSQRCQRPETAPRGALNGRNRVRQERAHLLDERRVAVLASRFEGTMRGWFAASFMLVVLSGCRRSSPASPAPAPPEARLQRLLHTPDGATLPAAVGLDLLDRAMREPRPNWVSQLQPTAVSDYNMIGLTGSETSPSWPPIPTTSAVVSDDFACLSAESKKPQITYPVLGDERPKPAYLRTVIDWLAAAGCPRSLQQTCNPAFVLNEKDKRAAFFWREDTIRYSWAYILAQRSLIVREIAVEDQEDAFYAFISGAIAHEYGHYVDYHWGYGFSANLEHNSIIGVNLGEKREYARRELWADWFSGCMLGMTQNLWAKHAMTAFLRSVEWNQVDKEYPTKELRLSAFSAGMTRCEKVRTLTVTDGVAHEIKMTDAQRAAALEELRAILADITKTELYDAGAD